MAGWLTGTTMCALCTNDVDVYQHCLPQYGFDEIESTNHVQLFVWEITLYQKHLYLYVSQNILEKIKNQKQKLFRVTHSNEHGKEFMMQTVFGCAKMYGKHAYAPGILLFMTWTFSSLSIFINAKCVVFVYDKPKFICCGEK